MVWIWQMEILWCMFVIPMGGSWYNSGCITSATYVATQGQFSWNEDVITIRIAIRLLLGGLIVDSSSPWHFVECWEYETAIGEQLLQSMPLLHIGL